MATDDANFATMEEAKNMALLFFMDHLMQKNGRRTIHDLSCQFGARGFTAEMREAVGATQDGLSGFLALYPSLFQLHGDEVSLSALDDSTAGDQLLKNLPSCNRDYCQEAVHFFEMKLQKFGPELQIKSLLGHRSQAAPEVRLVSGRHLKEFAHFLQDQTEHFVVEGDRVRLRNMPEPEQTTDLDENGYPLTEICAKQTVVDFLVSTLEEVDEKTLPFDRFYRYYCDRFSHSLRQHVATNPKELLQFLKLNRAIFFIRSNRVSLVKNRAEVVEGGNETEFETTPFGDRLLEKIVLVKALKSAQVMTSNYNKFGIYHQYFPLFSSAVCSLLHESPQFVAIDFKTVILGSQEEQFLNLVIIGTSTGRFFMFDLAHSDSILLESGLIELLESNQLLKVMHNSRGIGTLLYQRYQITMRNVFDTQIAHNVLQHEKFDKPFHEMRVISFVNLLRVYHSDSLIMSDLTPIKLAEMTTKTWSQRPLTDEMFPQIIEQTRLLSQILYRILNDALSTNIRPFFEQKCAEILNQNSIHQLALISIEHSQNVQHQYDSQTVPYRPPQKMDRKCKKIEKCDNFDPKCETIEQENAHELLDAITPDMNGYCLLSTVDSATQTFSTGEIVALTVFYDT